MKWIHVQLGKDRVDCPASYIEGYVEGISELEVKSKVWVFWSPVETDTPKRVLAKQRKLIHVTSQVLRKNNGELIAGYYEGTILLIKDSEAALEESLDSKRVSVPTSKVSPSEPKTSKKAGGKEKKNNSPNDNVKAADLKRKRHHAKKLTVDDYDKVSPSNQSDSTSVDKATSSGEPPNKKAKVDHDGILKSVPGEAPNKKVEVDPDLLKALPQMPGVTRPLIPLMSTKCTLKDKPTVEGDCGDISSAFSPHGLEVETVMASCEDITQSPMKKLTSVVQEQPLNKSPLSVAESKLKRISKKSSDSDSTDISCDDNSDSDVPISVHKEIVDNLKEEKAAKREVKKKLKCKVALLQLQLEQAETKLRLEREEKTRLEGEMLREHIRSKTKKVSKGTEVGESPKEPSSSQTSNGKEKKGTVDSPDVVDSPASNESGGTSSPFTAEKKKPDQNSSGERKKVLSNALLAKREALLKRTPKQKKASNSVRRSLFSEEDWNQEEWVFSTAQKKALNKSVKKGAGNDSRFVKKAIDLMWDREELCQRSSKGLPAFNCKEEARPECTPLKKAYLCELVVQRALLEGDSKEEAAKRGDLEKLEITLSSKITTVRRDFKKQPLRAAEDDSDEANDQDVNYDDLDFENAITAGGKEVSDNE